MILRNINKLNILTRSRKNKKLNLIENLTLNTLIMSSFIKEQYSKSDIVYNISLKDICEVAEISKTNVSWVKKALLKLEDLKYSIEGKFVEFFDFINIQRGKIDFKINDFFKNLMFSKEKNKESAYRRFFTSIFKKLKKHKYSIPLYEILLGYLPENKNYVEKKYLITEFRELMDCQNKYPKLSNFDNSVIYSTVDEINEKTNITINYLFKDKNNNIVTDGRVAKYIHFFVKRKKDFDFDLESDEKINILYNKIFEHFREEEVKQILEHNLKTKEFNVISDAIDETNNWFSTEEYKNYTNYKDILIQSLANKENTKKIGSIEIKKELIKLIPKEFNDDFNIKKIIISNLKNGIKTDKIKESLKESLKEYDYYLFQNGESYTTYIYFLKESLLKLNKPKQEQPKVKTFNYDLDKFIKHFPKEFVDNKKSLNTIKKAIKTKIKEFRADKKTEKEIDKLILESIEFTNYKHKKKEIKTNYIYYYSTQVLKNNIYLNWSSTKLEKQKIAEKKKLEKECGRGKTVSEFDKEKINFINKFKKIYWNLKKFAREKLDKILEDTGLFENMIDGAIEDNDIDNLINYGQKLGLKRS